MAIAGLIHLPRSGIYAIRNIISGRVYVGSAASFRHRWATHRYLLRKGRHHSRSLQRSWDKHGKQFFTFEVLEFVDERACIYEREQHWMNALSALCPEQGFNMVPFAGRGTRGYKASAATKAAQSARRKGRTVSAETRARIAATRIARGYKNSEKTKALIAAANSARKISDETREKLGASSRGKKRPPEFGAKISATTRGRKLSDEQKAKMAGRPVSVETRAKISAANKGRRHPASLAALRLRWGIVAERRSAQ